MNIQLYLFVKLTPMFKKIWGVINGILLFRSSNLSDNEQNNKFQARYRSWIVNIDEPSEVRRISDRIEEEKLKFKNPSRKAKRSEEEYRHYSGYNIKKVTKSKAVKHIDEMIQDELGLSDKSVWQWVTWCPCFPLWILGIR